MSIVRRRISGDHALQTEEALSRVWMDKIHARAPGRPFKSREEFFSRFSQVVLNWYRDEHRSRKSRSPVETGIEQLDVEATGEPVPAERVFETLADWLQGREAHEVTLMFLVYFASRSPSAAGVLMNRGRNWGAVQFAELQADLALYLEGRDI